MAPGLRNRTRACLISRQVGRIRRLGRGSARDASPLEVGMFVNRRVDAALSPSGRRTGFRARSDAQRSRADLAGNGQVNALALSASNSSRLIVPSSNSFFALSISLAAPPEPAVVRTYSSNCACAAAASR